MFKIVLQQQALRRTAPSRGALELRAGLRRGKQAGPVRVRQAHHQPRAESPHGLHDLGVWSAGRMFQACVSACPLLFEEGRKAFRFKCNLNCASQMGTTDTSRS